MKGSLQSLKSAGVIRAIRFGRFSPSWISAGKIKHPGRSTVPKPHVSSLVTMCAISFAHHGLARYSFDSSATKIRDVAIASASFAGHAMPVSTS